MICASVLREWILKVREVKSEMKIWFTHFENEKWNENALISRSRVKSEMKMSQNRDREWKVNWKCLEIEKWNFSRIFEKFLRNSWESRDQENFKFCYKCFSFWKLLLWNTTKCYFWINMSQGILGKVLGWDMYGCVDGKFLLAPQSSANSRSLSRGPSNPSSPVNLWLLNI